MPNKFNLKDFARVGNKDIVNIWECEDCGKEAGINPDYHEESGNPMCHHCDREMIYVMSYVRRGALEIIVSS